MTYELERRACVVRSITFRVTVKHAMYGISKFIDVYLETQTTRNGCSNMAIEILYIGNGCLGKHPFVSGCLVSQVYIYIHISLMRVPGVNKHHSKKIQHQTSLQSFNYHGFKWVEYLDPPVGVSWLDYPTRSPKRFQTGHPDRRVLVYIIYL